MFSTVPAADYLDSIWCDIENAAEEIAENPMYLTLNLCRVLAYKKDGLIVSKKEGGEWGLKNVCEPEFRALIKGALKEYQSGETMVFELSVTRKFADYLIREIQGNER